MNGLIFYESFHQNPTNQLIHFFCIPIITICLLNFLSLYKLNFYFDKDNCPIPLKTSGDKILIYIYCCFYLMNYGIKIGFIMSIYSYISYIIANDWREFDEDWKHHTVATFCWAWGFQFFGHYIEGKQPALTESVTQAFTHAPLFVVKYIYPSFLNGFT